MAEILADASMVLIGIVILLWMTLPPSKLFLQGKSYKIHYKYSNGGVTIYPKDPLYRFRGTIFVIFSLILIVALIYLVFYIITYS